MSSLSYCEHLPAVGGKQPKCLLPTSTMPSGWVLQKCREAVRYLGNRRISHTDRRCNQFKDGKTPACGRYGWRFGADGCEVGVRFSTRETRIIGALGPDAVHIKVVDSVNTDTLIEFLKELRPIYKKFVMFLDNLSAHKAAKVSKYIESTDGDVILVYLPKYTSQLNPMEIQWRVLKNMLAQRCFKNAEELAKSIRILVDTGQLLPVKQMDYMIP